MIQRFSLVARTRALEALVPLLVIVGCAFFLAGSYHLSAIALILPFALIGVIGLAITTALAGAFRSRAERVSGDDDDQTLGPVFASKPWLLILLPLALTFTLDWLGAFVTLVLLVFFAQLIFDHRTPLRSFLISLGVTVPVYVLFAHFLYVRFPAGALGLG